MPDWNLDRIADRFQQAAFDPTLWPDTLHALSRSVGALGAVMLPLDQRLEGAPYSPDMEGVYRAYFAGQWQTRDDRDVLVPLIVRRGIACDQDLITADEMRTRPYYRDFLERHDCRWTAILGHLSEGGFYYIGLQRTIRQGPFEPDEVRRLSTLCRSFADTTVLARRLGLGRVAGLADAMQFVQQPAMVLDKGGRVLALNELAERMLGDGIDVAHRSLSFRDPQSQTNFDAFLAKALDKRAVEGTVVDVTSVRGRRGIPLRLRAIALREWVRYTFTGARVLVLFGPPSVEDLLRSTYGLTKAEIRLATSIAAGQSVAETAKAFGISYETGRSQLRAVFSKTGTNRQGQLIALVKHLPSMEETGASFSNKVSRPHA